MYVHRHLLSILVFILLAICAAFTASAMGIFPATPADAPGPLPNDCQDVTGIGEEPPVCCAFGYVYYAGVPISGAQVTIQSASGLFHTTTTAGSASVRAYYAVSLSASPLNVAPGETITVTATYSGTTASAV